MSGYLSIPHAHGHVQDALRARAHTPAPTAPAPALAARSRGPARRCPPASRRRRVVSCMIPCGSP
eukprot:290132-Rhodomonas_salina.4